MRMSVKGEYFAKLKRKWTSYSGGPARKPRGSEDVSQIGTAHRPAQVQLVQLWQSTRNLRECCEFVPAEIEVTIFSRPSSSNLMRRPARLEVHGADCRRD